MSRLFVSLIVILITSTAWGQTTVEGRYKEANWADWTPVFVEISEDARSLAVIRGNGREIFRYTQNESKGIVESGQTVIESTPARLAEAEEDLWWTFPLGLLLVGSGVLLVLPDESETSDMVYGAGLAAAGFWVSGIKDSFSMLIFPEKRYLDLFNDALEVKIARQTGLGVMYMTPDMPSAQNKFAANLIPVSRRESVMTLLSFKF